MTATLLLRADASAQIGIGHVMRGLALAQAWQDSGGRVVFAWTEMPPALRDRLTRENILTVQLAAKAGSDQDAQATVALARQEKAAWLGVDGYRFGPAYLDQVRTGGSRLLVVDDMAQLEQYPVDLLLNQNLSANPGLYAGKIAGCTDLLLGPHYSLLRREFRTLAPRSRSPDLSVRRVLVSFGGSDGENFSSLILTRLAQISSPVMEIRVLAGAANPHIAHLKTLAAQAACRCEILVNVENVAAVMNWADVAITAAGSTVWELASLRLPALIGAVEDNQLAGMAALAAVPFFRVVLAQELAERDLGRDLEDLLHIAAGSAAAGGFDARGAVRVVEKMTAKIALSNRDALLPA